MMQRQDVRPFLLTSMEERKLIEITQSLKLVHDAMLKLQKDDMTLSDAHACFAVLSDSIQLDDGFSFLDLYENRSYILDKLDPNRSFDSHFENGAVKVLNGQQHALSSREKTDIKCLRVDAFISEGKVVVQNENAANVDGASSSLDDLINAKKRKVTLEYIDLRFIPPTSNICERFFSAAGRCYNDLRKSLENSSLEVQLFLHINRDLWDKHTVVQASDKVNTNQ
jgi:hypothetical protein